MHRGAIVEEDGTRLGPASHCAGPRGHLRARRQGGLPVVGWDERHPGQGGRRGRNHHGRPDPWRRENDIVLAAARIAGVDRVFTVGGAQVVAALAYGTQTIPAVDKITGPGNAYVACAKRAFGVVGIDMVAGPSEILVIWRRPDRPGLVAMDLFSQAEHDEIAQAICCARTLSSSRVRASIDRLLPEMPRQDIIRANRCPAVAR